MYKTYTINLAEVAHNEKAMRVVAEQLSQWLDQPELDELEGPDSKWYADQQADWGVDERH